MAEQSRNYCCAMCHGHEVMLHAVRQHVEAFPECHITHDVKSVKVEPKSDVEWLPCIFIDTRKKFFSVLRHSGLVVLQGYPFLSAFPIP